MTKNKTALTNLTTLAGNFRSFAIAALDKKRKADGFQHFMGDLKGLTIDDYQQKKLQFINSEKYKNLSNEEKEKIALVEAIRTKKECPWELVSKPGGGIIKVDLNKVTQDDINEVHSFLNAVLGDKQWYELAPANAKGLKTLGKMKANPAVDPVFIVQDKDGHLKVLCGKRPTGEYAFPGGMNEDTVKQTCINELIEEIFGGSLFASGEQNTRDVNKLINEAPGEFEKRFTLALRAFSNEMKLDDSKKPIIDEMKQIKGNSMEEVCNKLTTHLRRSLPEFSEAAKEHALLRLKCNLFEYLLPENYKVIEEVVNKKLKQLPSVKNASDPRNSPVTAELKEIAWMETTPLVGAFTDAELNKIATNAGLSMKAGDDLDAVGLKSIIEFCKNPYSDHGGILIDGLAHLIQAGKLKRTATLDADIEIIKWQLELKKLNENQINSDDAYFLEHNLQLILSKLVAGELKYSANLASVMQNSIAAITEYRATHAPRLQQDQFKDGIYESQDANKIRECMNDVNKILCPTPKVSPLSYFFKPIIPKVKNADLTGMKKLGLLVIDMQPDFQEGGSLAVPGGKKIVDEINKLIVAAGKVMYSRDMHSAEPEVAVWTKDINDPKKDIGAPVSEKTMADHPHCGGCKWCSHCVRNTNGSNYAPDMIIRSDGVHVEKGTGTEHQFGAVWGQGSKSTGVIEKFREANMDTIVVTGLATNFCVRDTVRQLLAAGFNVIVPASTVRGIFVKPDASVDDLTSCMLKDEQHPGDWTLAQWRDDMEKHLDPSLLKPIGELRVVEGLDDIPRAQADLEGNLQRIGHQRSFCR